MRKVTLRIPVYTFQIDIMGHVSNIVYLQWMEMLRCELLVAMDMPIHTLVEKGYGPALVSTEIKYIRPTNLGDVVTGEVWLSELGSASATLELRFFNQRGELVSEGRQRGAFVDVKTGKLKRLGADEKAAFGEFLNPPVES